MLHPLLTALDRHLHAAGAPRALEGWRRYVLEFWYFGLKEARACAFAGSFFALLAISRHVPLGALPRYDFLLLGALLKGVGPGHQNFIARTCASILTRSPDFITHICIFKLCRCPLCFSGPVARAPYFFLERSHGNQSQ